MEDGVIVVACFAMGDEVLYGFWCSFGEESDVDVAVGGVYDGSVTAFSRFGFYLLASIEIPWFLVLYISSGFADFGFIGEDVEADFT